MNIAKILEVGIPVAVGAGVLLGGVALYESTKTRKTVNKMAKAIDDGVTEASKLTEVSVSADIAKKAVDKAVDREVSEMVYRATRDALDSTRDEVKRAVASEISRQYGDFQRSVSDQLASQVAKLDLDKLKAEVVARAKQTAIEELKTSLGDITRSYNSQLENVSAIYSGMAKTYKNMFDHGAGIDAPTQPSKNINLNL